MTKIFYRSATFFIFFLLFLYFFHPVTNLVGDLGYYLKIGEIITQTYSIPSTNLFSYTEPAFPFINPNWLSEVLFYLIEKMAGLNGLIFFSVSSICASFGLLFISAARKYDYFALLIVSLLSIHVLYERTEVKPELLSYVFLAGFITLLYTYKARFTNWIYVLIPLMIVWVNVHIYFFTGILVVFLFLLDVLIVEKEKISSQKVRTLVFVLVGVLLATLLNPQFIKGALYPFFVLNNYAFPVEENSNFFKAVSNYTDTTFIFFEILVGTLWFSMLFSLRKLQLVDVMLAVVFTMVGFFAVRAFPLFVIGSFITTVKAFSYLLKEICNYIPPKHVLWYELSAFILFCLLLIPTIQLNLQIHGLGLGVYDNVHPAIDFLKKHHLNGPIYNNYDIGGYLIYSLYPQEKVFVDARPEAYSKTFFENTYLPLQINPQVFSKVSNTYKFTVILIKHTDTSEGNLAHIQSLISDPVWKMVFLNSSVVIFIKDIPENEQLIRENLVTESKLPLTQDDLNNKNNVRQLVNFFRLVGWENSWLIMNQRYLLFEPNNCVALQNIAYIYQKQERKDAETYARKFMERCMR